MLTAKIKPIQLIVIRKEVNERNKIFLFDLKIEKNSLVLPFIVIMITKNTNDQKPRCSATSKAGINLISLKNNGCGTPQKIEARKV